MVTPIIPFAGKWVHKTRGTPLRTCRQERQLSAERGGVCSLRVPGDITWDEGAFVQGGNGRQRQVVEIRGCLTSLFVLSLLGNFRLRGREVETKRDKKLNLFQNFRCFENLYLFNAGEVKSCLVIKSIKVHYSLVKSCQVWLSLFKNQIKSNYIK